MLSLVANTCSACPPEYPDHESRKFTPDQLSSTILWHDGTGGLGRAFRMVPLHGGASMRLDGIRKGRKLPR